MGTKRTKKALVSVAKRFNVFSADTPSKTMAGMVWNIEEYCNSTSFPVV